MTTQRFSSLHVCNPTSKLANIACLLGICQDSGVHYCIHTLLCSGDCAYAPTLACTGVIWSACPAANGERTLIVDMGSPALQPPGWWEHPVPGLHHWTDVSVYELHIRDFR